MNQNKQYFEADEIEIDLIEFAKRLIIQWRPILCFMLIMGFFTSFYFYHKEYKEYIAVKTIAVNKQKADEDTDKDNKRVEDVIVEDEVDTLAVEKALIIQDKINVKLHMEKENPIYSTDAYDRKSASIKYLIKNASKDDIPALKDYYLSFITGQEMKDAITSKYPNVSKKDIGNILSGAVSTMDSYVTDGDGFFSVNISEISGIDVNDVANIVDKTLHNVNKKASSLVSEHALMTLMINKQSGIDTSLIEAQQTMDSDIVSLKQELRDSVSTMSDETFKKFIKSTYALEYPTEYTSDDVGVVNKAVESTEATEEEQEDEGDIVSITRPVWQAKYFLLGMIAAAMIFSCVQFLWFIVTPTVLDANQIQAWTGISSLGNVRSYSYKSMLKRFWYDRWVFELIRKKELNRYRKVELIAERIKFLVEKDKLKRIDFVFIPDKKALSRMNTYALGFYNQIKRILKEDNIPSEFLFYNPEKKVETEKQLYDRQDAIIITGIGHTPYKALASLLNDCKDMEVNIPFVMGIESNS